MTDSRTDDELTSPGGDARPDAEALPRGDRIDPLDPKILRRDIDRARDAHTIGHAAVRAEQRDSAHRISTVDARVDVVEGRVAVVERRLDGHGTALQTLGDRHAAVTVALARREGTPAAQAHQTAAEALRVAREADRAARQARSEETAATAFLVESVQRHLEAHLAAVNDVFLENAKLGLELRDARAEVRELRALVLAGQRKHSEVRLDREAQEGLAIAEQRERDRTVIALLEQLTAAKAETVVAKAETAAVHTGARADDRWLRRSLLALLVLLIVIVAILKGVDPKGLPIPLP